MFVFRGKLRWLLLRNMVQLSFVTSLSQIHVRVTFTIFEREIIMKNVSQCGRDSVHRVPWTWIRKEKWNSWNSEIHDHNYFFQEFSESVYPSIKEVLRLGGPYPQTIRSGFGDYWYAGFHDQECFRQICPTSRYLLDVYSPALTACK